MFFRNSAAQTGYPAEDAFQIRGEQAYKRMQLRTLLGLGLLASLLVGAGAAGVLIGTSETSLGDLFRAIAGEQGPKSVILLGLRLPRVVMAFLVGAGLAVGGCICQAILKNPLASPFTLGVSSGAGFGAVVGIVFFRAAHHNAVALSAFVFSLISTLLILGVSRLKNAGTETLILGGVAVMFLFSSLTSFVQYTGTMEEVQDVVFWFFGSLSKAGWSHIWVSAFMVLGPMPFVYARAWDYNALMSGDETASTLGVSVERLRMEGILLSSLMTAGAICFVGVIGFVGLVAPHISRMLVGSDHRYLLPASALVGASLVTLADVISRIIWPPQVIPIGIMTSLLGVPFFFYLLVKKSRRFW
ncbi:FecCD family ABC transporter permease [Desulfatibacillum aliphaticivorans]|uniref:FecCD family ABC transporter permease n=1 Tax=Desulfatibacillum aliphaticivorans TaxID=218208 RepID=UPI00041495CD|nr:iron ABC transporter permease [Desulfatibacillum aliphaticivorans]